MIGRAGSDDALTVKQSFISVEIFTSKQHVAKHQFLAILLQRLSYIKTSRNKFA